VLDESRLRGVEALPIFDKAAGWAQASVAGRHFLGRPKDLDCELAHFLHEVILSEVEEIPCIRPAMIDGRAMGSPILQLPFVPYTPPPRGFFGSASPTLPTPPLRSE